MAATETHVFVLSANQRSTLGFGSDSLRKRGRRAVTAYAAESGQVYYFLGERNQPRYHRPRLAMAVALQPCDRHVLAIEVTCSSTESEHVSFVIELNLFENNQIRVFVFFRIEDRLEHSGHHAWNLEPVVCYDGISAVPSIEAMIDH